MKVKRACFYAKYGDIFAAACEVLEKDEAEARDIEGWRVNPDDGLDDFSLMNISLITEKLAWDEFLKGKTSRDSCSWHYAILETCRLCRSSSYDAVEIWREANARMSEIYQEANDLRIDFPTMIKEGKFRDIAEILYSDYCDLPSMMEPGSKALLDLLQTLILTITDAWFVRNKFNRWTHRVWLSSAVLDKFQQNLAAEDNIDADVVKEMHAHIA